MDPSVRGICNSWMAEYENASDPQSKRTAAKVLNMHYDHLDIQDDGKPNKSYTGFTPPPLDSDTTPPPATGSETSSSETESTSGETDTTSDEFDSNTPLLDSLGTEFGLKEQILLRNKGDPEKAEKWLQERGYDGNVEGLVTENGEQKIQQGSTLYDLYTQAFNGPPPDRLVASMPSATEIPPPATDPSQSQTPLLDSLDNDLDIKGRILRINDNDPAKAEKWLEEHGYNGEVEGLVPKPDGGQSIKWGSTFHYLYTEAYGLEVPPGTFDHLKGQG